MVELSVAAYINLDNLISISRFRQVDAVWRYIGAHEVLKVKGKLVQGSISDRMQNEQSQPGEDAALPSVRNLSKGQVAFFALKLVITVVCFWYLFRHIDLAELRRNLPGLKVRWVILAIGLLITQIPLLGLRWLQIAKTLTMRGRQLTFVWMTIATAIGQFFGQIMPVVAGDGIRVWFLAHFGNNWRDAT